MVRKGDIGSETASPCQGEEPGTPVKSERTQSQAQ